MKFDTFLATVDDWGKFQKIKYTLICLTYMLPPIMVYTYTFTAATPDFRCANTNSSLVDGYSESANRLLTGNYKSFEEQCKNEQSHLSISECQRCYYQDNSTARLKKCSKYVFSREHYTKTLVEEVRLYFIFKSVTSMFSNSGIWFAIE